MLTPERNSPDAFCVAPFTCSCCACTWNTPATRSAKHSRLFFFIGYVLNMLLYLIGCPDDIVVVLLLLRNDRWRSNRRQGFCCSRHGTFHPPQFCTADR